QNPLYHVYLGNFYRSRAPEAAIMEFDQAIQLDPQLALTYIYRGQHYNSQGEFQRALQDFDRAIRLNGDTCADPECAKPYFFRGLVYLDLGLYEQSVESLTQAIGLDSKLVEAFVQRGKAQAELGNEAQALLDQQEAERLKGE
ncbi:MAG TPA: tetratricopeptide repeat protein, partial [Dehalococcoidia bacterium]|nr:tetratricopeptide repeat protein [Dehalococcoidia bacterium]